MIRLFFLFLFFSISLNGYAQDHPPFTSMDVFELEWVTDPQISPNGEYVVYERRGMDIMKDRRTSRIWLIKTDGTEHQKLSSNDVNESKPRWSPDGKRIAFVSSTEEGAELFVYWLKTGKIARLSQLENSPSNLAWSPDGKHIAFTKFVNGSELSLVKAPRKPKGAKWAEAPRVTTRFKHERDGAGKMKPGHTHIFVIPAEGGTARQLTSGNFNHGAPTWTKDGKSLLFSGNLNKDWEHDFRNSEIYKLNIAEGNTNALTHRKGPDYSISLSPDGKRIAYTGFDDKVQTYQLTKLSITDLEGRNIKELKLDLDRSVANPVWDSNSKGIYFQYDDKGNTKIGYFGMDGKCVKLRITLVVLELDGHMEEDLSRI